MNTKKWFDISFLLISIVTTVVVILRSYYVPFNHDETATFFYYIQTGKYWPFFSHVDANNHVLNSLLGNISFLLLGSSPLALRIPNILAFIILIYAIYRLCKLLNTIGSKAVLMMAFLVSFHWISFFNVCRGYGLSMALLLLGVAYMLYYIKKPGNLKYLLLALLMYQLAISANLILIVVVALLSAIIVIVQLFNRQLFTFSSLFVWLIHVFAIYYWLSFSFFLQDNGALYYGAGESYWQVTFVSLIQLIIGLSSPFIKWILILFFIFILLLVLYVNRKNFFKIIAQLKQPSISLLFLFVLGALSIGFYIMHKIMGVNYPEDRTGLFFYVFFVLLIVFTLDYTSVKLRNTISVIISLMFIFHFIINLNFRKHSLGTYETIPNHFYTTLLSEQKKTPERITIGGHRVRELFFGFMNYRNDGYLNPADPVETMQMNCDYYIATKQEEKYFEPYYSIIDTEPDWGFLILKRKQKIIRNKVLELNNILIDKNENEFIDIYSKGDSTIKNTNPLLAQVNFDIDKIETPPNIWLVFQINDSLDNTLYFKRYPLQWSGYNTNGKKNFSYSLTSGNLPSRTKKIACFFWNIDKKPISIKVNSLKISQLDGKGVNYVAPDIK